MIDLTFTEDALSPAAKAEVVEKLTEALLRNEGAPVSRMTRGLTWVFLHELPPGCANIAGRPAVRPVYRLFVTVPQGTLLQGPGPVGATSRRNLVREAAEIILDAEGTGYSDREALRIYVVIREVDDGYWGGGGRMMRMEDIAALAAPEGGSTAAADALRPLAEEMLAEQLGPVPA